MLNGFQIEVTSKARPGTQVFILEASSQFDAELRLERDCRTLPEPVFNLRRMLCASDIERHALADGVIVQIS